MTFDEHRQAYGGKAAATFKVFSGKGEYNQSSFDQFKRETCTGLETDTARSAAQYFFQQTPDQTAVQAWRDCMLAREGLTCFPEPQPGVDEVPIVINWRSDFSGIPKVTYSSVSKGNRSRAASAKEGELLGSGDTLARGDTTVGIVKPADVALLATLSVRIDDVARSCRVFVPAVKKEPALPPQTTAPAPPPVTSFVRLTASFSIHDRISKPQGVILTLKAIRNAEVLASSSSPGAVWDKQTNQSLVLTFSQPLDSRECKGLEFVLASNNMERPVAFDISVSGLLNDGKELVLLDATQGGIGNRYKDRAAYPSSWKATGCP